MGCAGGGGGGVVEIEKLFIPETHVRQRGGGGGGGIL
jgi:hypothetical protein